MSSFKELGIPFKEVKGNLTALYTNDVRDEETVWNVRAETQLGTVQSFPLKEIEDKTRPLKDSLQKNNVSTLNARGKKLVSKYKVKIMVLKENCVLFSRLYISFKTLMESLRTSSVRKGAMAAFTVARRITPKRNQSVTRKVLARCLQLGSGSTECGSNHSGWNCCSRDASAVSTFEEYFNSVVAPYSLTQLDGKGLNIVLEVYKDHCLKKETTEKRRIGSEERDFAVYQNSV